MQRWKKDATEFKVGVYHDDRRGTMLVMPKPVVEILGTPNTVVFTIEGEKIVISTLNNGCVTHIIPSKLLYTI